MDVSILFVFIDLAVWGIGTWHEDYHYILTLYVSINIAHSIVTGDHGNISILAWHVGRF